MKRLVTVGLVMIVAAIPHAMLAGILMGLVGLLNRAAHCLGIGWHAILRNPCRI